MRLTHAIANLLIACLSSACWGQAMPTQRDIDRAKQRFPSDQEIERAIRARQGEKGAAADALEEAARRVRIPQGEVSPKVQFEPNVALNPDSVTEMYESFKRHGHGDQKLDDVMLFVSLSIPEEALHRLARQAARAGVPLVFRGLRYGIGPGKTGEGVKLLRPIAKFGARTVIHPVLFKDFAVSQVPTLVVTGGARAGCDSTECAAPPVKVVGDASLDYLLEQVAGRNDAYGKAARDALSRMGR